MTKKVKFMKVVETDTPFIAGFLTGLFAIGFWILTILNNTKAEIISFCFEATALTLMSGILFIYWYGDREVYWVKE